MRLISPSHLAIKGGSANQTGASFKPIGLPAKVAGRCLMCGHSHEVDSLVVKANLPDTFTNWSDLIGAGSQVICGYCASVSQDPWTQAWMNSVITEHGVYKFASNNDIGHWLMNPPDGPFMMMRGDQQKQHLVWRTPVNYSKEVYQIRIGEKVIVIRRKHLMASIEAAQALSVKQNAALTSLGKRKGNGKSSTAFNNPFIRPIRNMDDYLAGQIKDSVLKLALEDVEVELHISTLRQCTPGEIWALSVVLYATPIESVTRHILKTNAVL